MGTTSRTRVRGQARTDRKIAAVIVGKCVHSGVIVWNPIPQTDPQWHFDRVMESLRLAASHLPRVDAIGGSSAGVIVNSRVKVASLFRGVPIDLHMDADAVEAVPPPRLARLPNNPSRFPATLDALTRIEPPAPPPPALIRSVSVMPLSPAAPFA